MTSRRLLIGITVAASTLFLVRCRSTGNLFGNPGTCGRIGGGYASTGGHGTGGTGTGATGLGAGGYGASGGDAGTGGNGASGAQGGTGGSILVDCDNIPSGPFSFTVKWGNPATEDMAFDHLGNLIGYDNAALFKSTYGGQATLWVPGAGGFVAGLRATTSGLIVYNEVNTNTVFKIVPPASKTMVLSGLAYPNGMEADNDGNVVVAEQNGNRVRRINPENGQFQILAENINAANGLSFSPDYKTLYVGSFGGNIIYKITLDAQNQPVSTSTFIQDFAQYGMLDGMGVDACGNVYVCEYVAGYVWRIPPNGQNPQVIVDLSSQTTWIPNLDWGSGYGGWDPLVLYVRDMESGKMYEVPVGVPGKPTKYP